MTEYYIGLMSGTSLDGVDGVVADFSGDQLHLLASASCAFDPDFKSELLALNAPVPNELHRAAVAGNAVAIAYADVVHQLLAQLTAQNLAVSQVRAIGAHGQTVRHQPRIVSKPTVDAGYTLQLINPALLAALRTMTSFDLDTRLLRQETLSRYGYFMRARLFKQKRTAGTDG